MIAFVSGILSAVYENKVEIDAGTLGYEVFVPGSVLDRLPSQGDPVKLYTYLNVKEDEMSLFGFLDRDSLELFKQLIAVSGIGPKGGLAILSTFSPSDLRFAIMAGDAKSIARAPGVGSKTAQRIVIELKDKMSFTDTLEHINENTGNVQAPADGSARSEAILALTALGYSSSDALRAVSKIDTKDADVETILKEALKEIGR